MCGCRGGGVGGVARGSAPPGHLPRPRQRPGSSGRLRPLRHLPHARHRGTAEPVTMEAMAAGKPVVAADAMALPHLVHPGPNGYHFPPSDVRALADRLMELLDDPASRRRMGEADGKIVAGHGIHRTLTTFEALSLHAAGHPAATTALPLPASTMESEHDEYAARSGRR
ncbi:glycosyltransferase [Streptomyces sp. 2A115]|uniref:glycosyltransferase n=1 Tax=Streptomyces sp. 2A115 TaxID=3457439 RepID=UPI003FCF7B51